MNAAAPRGAPFAERPTLVPLEGGRTVLEGLWHKGAARPGLLILPPPPFEGSSMDHVVAAELAFAAARAGHPSLRFNYRGVGASQGPRATALEALLADASAALTVLEENLGVGAAGGRAQPGGASSVAAAALGASDAVALALARQVPLAGLVLLAPSLATLAELCRAEPPAPTVVALDAEALEAAVDSERLRQGLAARGVDLRLAPRVAGASGRGVTHLGRLAVEQLERCAGVLRAG